MSDIDSTVVVYKVGQYQFSEDLCIGVYDGTGFDSGTCDALALQNKTDQFKGVSLSQVVIRNNTIPVNAHDFSGITKVLDANSQAQCVMTGEDSATCWVWDAALRENTQRCNVKVGKSPECSQAYKRRSPDGFSYSRAPSALSAGRALVFGMLLAALLV
ncbi:hypothetical protein DL89DRAFT_291165 [Linderina pennispora]|uniref:Uncharacterized protein n=1 Tax=Linderina pennispora TaxID=61395 RepID=A0A1Y1WEI4_9FUNG|nr:uncharacterized protein DL89DRAFT_291165 [Linderina pennispora]ORX71882.1 hypothetical protein DL89DRAFT_291165 [Linderina pennispora]